MSGAGTAYCYLTDGRNSQDLREASYRSLRRFCGDVPVYVCTLADVYKNPRKWENLIDCHRTFGEVFGTDVSPDDLIYAGKCSSGHWRIRWRWLLMMKLALPFLPEFAKFENIVFLDDDIEITKPEFGRLPDICPLQPGADFAAGAAPHYLFATGDTSLACGIHQKASPFRSRVPDLYPHLCAGIMLHRAGGSDGLFWRLRRVAETLKKNPEPFAGPEEYHMVLTFNTQKLPMCISAVPEAPEIRMPGSGAVTTAQCMTIHYGGPRKRSKRCMDFISKYLDSRGAPHK